ncbi:hypothetical protein D1007_20880 [Hordeum vulgare]|nr:hypothetical protein D1007_20880 [Hordeum vulgare]
MMREERVGGAEEGDNLVERGATCARTKEHQFGVGGEQRNGKVLVAGVGLGREVLEHAHHEGGLTPDGLPNMRGKWRVCVLTLRLHRVAFI